MEGTNNQEAWPQKQPIFNLESQSPTASPTSRPAPEGGKVVEADVLFRELKADRDKKEQLAKQKQAPAVEEEQFAKKTRKKFVFVLIPLFALILISLVVYGLVAYKNGIGPFEPKSEKTSGLDSSSGEESTESLEELDSVFKEIIDDFEDLESEISEESELEADLDI